MRPWLKFVGGPFDGHEQRSPSENGLTYLCLGQVPCSHYKAETATLMRYVGPCDDNCPGGVGWEVWNARQR